MPTFYSPAKVTITEGGGPGDLLLLVVVAVLIIGSGVGADLLEGLRVALIVSGAAIGITAAAGLAALPVVLLRTRGTTDTAASLAGTLHSLEADRANALLERRSRRAITEAREQARDEALAWALEQIAARTPQAATPPNLRAWPVSATAKPVIPGTIVPARRRA
jgi:hypothetical protein